MMISDLDLATSSPRPRRSPAGGPSLSTPRGMVFAIAALPGAAEGFRWPTWLSPLASGLSARVPSTSKRSR